MSVTYAFDPSGANLRRVGSLAAQAQITTTREILRAEREALVILQRQLDLGSIAATDVMAQQTLVATTEAGLPALEKHLAVQRDLIAVLAGRFPSDAPAARFELTTLTLPRELPVSVPARLVRQRPDVLAAEAGLHAATAQVGVAIGDLLPQISLSAGAGGTATQVASLFAAGNTFWSAGASLSQTLFAGGAVWHRKKAADAALDAAGAQYRSVVLAAFQQVADALHALELDATSAGSGREAEQSYQQAELLLLQARAQRLADTAALFEALGGGWWNEPKPYQ